MWSRPESTHFPTVWHSFQAPDLDGSMTSYDIQDLPPERFEDAVSLMKESYLTDEPIARCLNLILEPGSVSDYISLWKVSIKQRMAVGCFKAGSSVLVAVNFLAVASKDDPKNDLKFQGRASQVTFDLYKFVLKEFNMFERFKGCDKYLLAYGMGVSRAYRNRGIATRFLEARLPMMRELGIPYTSTLFSAIGTQKAAEKAGYQVFYEIKYEDCVKRGWPLKDIGVPSAKLMGTGI